jgi:hypothetical protein
MYGTTTRTTHRQRATLARMLRYIPMWYGTQTFIFNIKYGYLYAITCGTYRRSPVRTSRSSQSPLSQDFLAKQYIEHTTTNTDHNRRRKTTLTMEAQRLHHQCYKPRPDPPVGCDGQHDIFVDGSHHSGDVIASLPGSRRRRSSHYRSSSSRHSHGRRSSRYSSSRHSPEGPSNYDRGYSSDDASSISSPTHQRRYQRSAHERSYQRSSRSAYSSEHRSRRDKYYYGDRHYNNGRVHSPPPPPPGRRSRSGAYHPSISPKSSPGTKRSRSPCVGELQSKHHASVSMGIRVDDTANEPTLTGHTFPN